MDLANAMCYGPIPAPLDSVKIAPETPFLLTFSAVNKGKADGKPLTQGEVLKRAEKLAASLKLTADDVVLSATNLNTEFGVCVNFAAFKNNSAV